MAEDGEYSVGPGRVRIKGLSKTVRALEKAGADAGEMRELMHDLGMLVVRAAEPPVLSGRLSGTIRAGRGKTKAVVRAGGARAPYAPVVHYGWPERGIAPKPYLADALRSERSDILRALDHGLAEILQRNELT